MNRQRQLLAALVAVLAASLLYAFWTMPRQEKAPPRTAPPKPAAAKAAKSAKPVPAGKGAGQVSSDRLLLELLDREPQPFPGAGRDIFRFAAAGRGLWCRYRAGRSAPAAATATEASADPGGDPARCGDAKSPSSVSSKRAESRPCFCLRGGCLPGQGRGAFRQEQGADRQGNHGQTIGGRLGRRTGDCDGPTAGERKVAAGNNRRGHDAARGPARRFIRGCQSIRSCQSSPAGLAPQAIADAATDACRAAAVGRGNTTGE